MTIYTPLTAEHICSRRIRSSDAGMVFLKERQAEVLGRFAGPPRREVIGDVSDEATNDNLPRIGFRPPIDWVDLAAKAIIVAGLGASIAMWVSM
jgi:hypothetical protein